MFVVIAGQSRRDLKHLPVGTAEHFVAHLGVRLHDLELSLGQPARFVQYGVRNAYLADVVHG